MSARPILKAGTNLTLDEFILYLQGVRMDYGNILVDYRDPELGDGLGITEGEIIEEFDEQCLRLQ